MSAQIQGETDFTAGWLLGTGVRAGIPSLSSSNSLWFASNHHFVIVKYFHRFSQWYIVENPVKAAGNVAPERSRYVGLTDRVTYTAGARGALLIVVCSAIRTGQPAPSVEGPIDRVPVTEISYLSCFGMRARQWSKKPGQPRPEEAVALLQPTVRGCRAVPLRRNPSFWPPKSKEQLTFSAHMHG